MKTFALSTSFAVLALAALSAQTPKPKPAAAPAKAPHQTPAPAASAQSTPLAADPDPVVLTIGDRKMTRSQYEAFVAVLPEQLRAQANGPNKRKFAEQIADMKALAYEARVQKLDQSPDFKRKAELQMDNLLASEMYQKLNDSVKVDDAALHSYYDQHKSEYEEAKASHILVRFKGSPVPLKKDQKELTEEEALAKARELREKIVKGAPFAEVAKAESDDAGSGANGGSLGSFTRGRMVPVFEQAAFTLPIGQISEPVKSQFGYHLILVESRTTKDFDSVKGQIEARVKPEMLRKAVDDVKKSVAVTMNDEYFGK
jgi:peptidyl-prolyl cis-trans isomerase C